MKGGLRNFAVLLVACLLATRAGALSTPARQLFTAQFSFPQGDASLPASARASIDAAAAQAQAHCGKGNTLLWVRYELAPHLEPRNDYRLLADRAEAVRRYLLRFAPKEWSVTFESGDRLHPPPAPVTQDKVTVTLSCGS